MEFKTRYFYLHRNGTIIEKSVHVCETNTTPEEYFAGDLVLGYWKVSTMEEAQAAFAEAEKIWEDASEGPDVKHLEKPEWID